MAPIDEPLPVGVLHHPTTGGAGLLVGGQDLPDVPINRRAVDTQFTRDARLDTSRASVLFEASEDLDAP
jgi:hypothetical protein